MKYAFSMYRELELTEVKIYRSKRKIKYFSDMLLVINSQPL